MTETCQAAVHWLTMTGGGCRPSGIETSRHVDRIAPCAAMGEQCRPADHHGADDGDRKSSSGKRIEPRIEGAILDTCMGGR
jgi:hypothetical protein